MVSRSKYSLLVRRIRKSDRLVVISCCMEYCSSAMSSFCVSDVLGFVCVSCWYFWSMIGVLVPYLYTRSCICCWVIGSWLCVWCRFFMYWGMSSGFLKFPPDSLISSEFEVLMGELFCLYRSFCTTSMVRSAIFRNPVSFPPAIDMSPFDEMNISSFRDSSEGDFPSSCMSGLSPTQEDTMSWMLSLTDGNISFVAASRYCTSSMSICGFSMDRLLW